MNCKTWILTLLILLALPLAAADVTGKWNGDVQLDMGAGTPTLDLKQEGENLTGTYTGAMGSAPLTGTLKGDKIEVQFKATYSGTEFDVKYSGAIEGDGTLKGTCDYGGQASGTWTAKRAT